MTAFVVIFNDYCYRVSAIVHIRMVQVEGFVGLVDHQGLFARIVTDIHAVGVKSTVLATDFGAAVLSLPVVGMRSYVAGLLEAGFSERDIRVMAGETPSMLLGLEG